MTALAPDLTVIACPDCGLPAVRTRRGLITPTTVRLGHLGPDGRSLYADARALGALIHRNGDGTAGHADHSCPPAGTQPTLFDAQEA